VEDVPPLSVTSTLTLPIAPDAFNAAARSSFKTEVAALLGVSADRLLIVTWDAEASATAGRRRVQTEPTSTVVSFAVLPDVSSTPFNETTVSTTFSNPVTLSFIGVNPVVYALGPVATTEAAVTPTPTPTPVSDSSTVQPSPEPQEDDDTTMYALLALAVIVIGGGLLVAYRTVQKNREDAVGAGFNHPEKLAAIQVRTACMSIAGLVLSRD
jgi:hypothetical protein